VETVSLSGNKRRSVLNLDGQLVDYSQGRNYTAHLVWPNNMREGNESKLTLIGSAVVRRAASASAGRGRSSGCLVQGSSPVYRRHL
jgi:type VI secretion system protein ImpL